MTIDAPIQDAEEEYPAADREDLNQTGPQRRWRRAFVTTSILLSLIATGIVMLPFVLRQTRLRDSLLNSSLESCGLTGISREVTGGWLTPITMRSITIKDPAGRFYCLIPELRTSLNFLDIMRGQDDLGKLVISDASLLIRLDADGNWPVAAKPSQQFSQLEFEIRDADFLLQAPWRTEAIINLSDVDLSGRVQRSASGVSELVVDECLLLDHVSLPTKATTQNLALIAPILAQSTRISGTASVYLNRTVIPMDGRTPKQFLSGRAEFHELNARLKEDWIEQVALLIGKAAQIDLPGRISVARDTVVNFQVLPTGVHHDGMAFLLPDLAPGLVAQTSGKIGLDESLDLELAMQLPPSLVPSDPLLGQVVRALDGTLTAKVKGTVSVPVLQRPDMAEVLSQVSARIHPASYENAAPALPGAIFDLVRDVSDQSAKPDEKASNIAGGIIGLIRSIDAARQESKQDKEKKADR
jgi:hypothetical protein